MKNTIRKIALLGGTLSLLAVAANSAFAHGNEKHESADKKNTDCHDTHGDTHANKAKDKTGAAHMKDCHDKAHKDHGHTGTPERMPHHDHQMGAHMKGGK